MIQGETGLISFRTLIFIQYFIEALHMNIWSGMEQPYARCILNPLVFLKVASSVISSTQFSWYSYNYNLIYWWHTSVIS